MKALPFLILWLLIAGCHTAPVECDKHLIAINPVPKVAARGGKPVVPQAALDASRGR